MIILQIKDTNFIFSLFFVTWCIIHLKAVNSEEPKYRKSFSYALEDHELKVFWILVIILTSFNLVARILRRFNYYLVGAIGMALLCFAQLFFVLVFMKHYISDSPEERDIFRERLSFIFLTFPYIVFGISTSLYCYQNEINEKTDQNRTKFQRVFLEFCFMDFQRLDLFFNFSLSFCMFAFFLMVVDGQRKFKTDIFFILAPLIPSTFTFLAFALKKKSYYIGTIICWGIFGVFSILLFTDAIKNAQTSRRHEIPALLSLAFVFFINTIVGFFSALSIYCQKRSKDRFVNPNYVSYTVAEDGVAI